MKTKIKLEEIKIYAYHGVLENERKIGAYYILDLELGYNFQKAMQTDSLYDTINYAQINEIVHQEMSISSNLLEFVVGRILKRIKDEFMGIDYIRIQLKKMNPPMKGEVFSAGVEVEEFF